MRVNSSEVLHVLIVDDEPDVAALHSRFVRALKGFEISAIVHTGAAALREIETNNPDVVLLDFGLPDIDGREVIRRIRASNRAAIEIIALTAANDLDSVRYARSAGVRHYLVKPFDALALHQRLLSVQREQINYEGVGSPELHQGQVDEILRGADPLSAVAPLPKGLAAETLDRVRAALRDCGGDVSTSDIAHAVGTSRATARRYLEFLCQLGEAVVEPKYGSVGRPENRYAAI